MDNPAYETNRPHAGPASEINPFHRGGSDRNLVALTPPTPQADSTSEINPFDRGGVDQNPPGILPADTAEQTLMSAASEPSARDPLAQAKRIGEALAKSGVAFAPSSGSELQEQAVEGGLGLAPNPPQPGAGRPKGGRAK